MNSTQPTQQQSIVVSKSKITNMYIVSQPMTYDFYLLYLLFTEQFPTNLDKNTGVEFCKNSSIKSLATSLLFIHKNHGHIEIFSAYDIKNTENLALPKSPKFIMTAKNFMNFMIQKSHFQKTQPAQLFIVIDNLGHAHLTTDLNSLQKTSFFELLRKKLARLFTRQAL